MRNLIYIIFLLCFSASAQNSLNDVELKLKDSSSYSFLISGHFYGGSAKTSGYPAASILGNIDKINESKSDFLVCLGDMFMDVSNDIPNYKRSLFSKLRIPIYNSVGNHDLTDDIYQENFGYTFYSFDLGGNIFLILDTEQNDGSIEGEQFELLKKTLKESPKNLFIFSHRPVWAEDDEEFAGVFKQNTQSLISNNYQSEILPLLEESKSKIYWFGGSLGGSAPASFFYHNKTKHITYIATAIRDLKRDAILKINLNESEVNFETISLTGQNLKPLEEYDVEYWKTEEADKINYRLIPLYIKQIVFNKSFFIGALIALLFVFVIRKLFSGKRS